MKQRNWLYPVGFFGIIFMNTLFGQWIVRFHAPPTDGRASGAGWVGGILLLGFLIQGLLNPLIGIWSDRTESSWGRRRPFILLGGLPLMLVFWALWRSHDPVWVTVTILLYGVFFVTVIQPYATLLPTVASESDIRVTVSVLAGLSVILGVGSALLIGPAIDFGQMAWLGAGVFGLTCLLPTLFLVEGKEHPATLPEGDGSLLRLFWQTGTKTEVLAFLVGNTIAIMLFMGLMMATPYVAEDLLGQDRAYTGVLNRGLFAGMIGTVILVRLVGKPGRFVPIFQASLVLAGCVLFGLYGVSFLETDWLPAWWIGFGLLGVPVLVALVAAPLILSRLAEADGQNREGLFFGLNGLAINIGNALASIGTTFLLESGTTGWVGGVRGILLLGGTLALIGGGVLFWARTD